MGYETPKEHIAFTLRNSESFRTKRCYKGHDKTFYSVITKLRPYGRWACKICNADRMAGRGD